VYSGSGYLDYMDVEHLVDQGCPTYLCIVRYEYSEPESSILTELVDLVQDKLASVNLSERGRLHESKWTVLCFRQSTLLVMLSRNTALYSLTASCNRPLTLRFTEAGFSCTGSTSSEGIELSGSECSDSVSHWETCRQRSGCIEAVIKMHLGQ
jgi:hypothetical protein